MKILTDFNKTKYSKLTKQTISTPKIPSERYKSEANLNDLEIFPQSVNCKSQG
jgi:hypothetical protein